MGNVLLVGTLDTKGREMRYIMDEIRALGGEPLVANIGVFDPMPTDVPIAYTAQDIAEAGGESLAELRTGGETGGARAHAMTVMTNGLSAILSRENEAGRFDAVLGFGGSSGSSVIGAAMQVLPVGVPKVLVSTMASGDTTPYVGTRDITLMYSVTDIAGLNRISRVVLRNAARAAAGMASGPLTDNADDQPLIAITMFGVTTPCVMAVQEQIEEDGFETTVFHATGSGGRAMEDLVRDGLVDGVIDLTTSELTDELVGGVLTAGPARMEAAGLAGIPQVLVPGALEVVNFGAEPTVPTRFRVPERMLHVHNAAVTIVRTLPEEARRLGEIFAQKASVATGPTAVVLPLKGLSALDAPGQPWENPVGNAQLFDAIRCGLREDIPIIEVDAAINDPVFADACVAAFRDLWANR
ncbi:MAG: Tm-1-like ATP-binding domain-containing protein [Propionibacteriaceae bacterium]|nr:Tm-1-like ATP-binding domain-containing protein [Propionibacteriaceae bacterium]